MSAPVSIREFIELGCKAGLLDGEQAMAFCQTLQQRRIRCTNPRQLASAMVNDRRLTTFQANQLLLGRWHGFNLSNKYRLLDCIGSGGMGTVYLCEHLRLQRLVAVKVLPVAQARDPGNLERFQREARAVAAVNHPNIVRAHDIDEDRGLHYLVMEYVDGDSLQNIIKKTGPLEPRRAAQYIAQAAAGLQHAHEAGLVHRDIKPDNLLLDRNGVIKILDLGLARFFRENADTVTGIHDKGAVLGTADYLAPEQIDDSNVDIRADIYSLGATFYFLLAGHAPFHGRSAAQKLVAHQMQTPRSIRSLRSDVPAELEAVLNRMLAKQPDERFQQPSEVAAALTPWTGSAARPPSEVELSVLPVRDELAAMAGLQTVVRSTTPAHGADIASLPTIISKSPQTPLPTANGSPPVAAPTDEGETPKGPARAAAPTSPALTALTDTDPFALVKAGSGLISEESVFCAQFTQGGSSNRLRGDTRRRTWVTLAVLAAVTGLVGLGCWFAVSQRNPTDDGHEVKVQTPPVTPLPPDPVKTKIDYVAAGSPFGKLQYTITGINGAVTGVALMPDGQKLVIATEDRTPKIWDVQTGQSVANLIGHAKAVACVAVSFDGEVALTGGQDGWLYLWQLKFGSQQKLAGAKAPVRCVAFVPPNEQAVSGGADNLLHLWDLKSGTILRTFSGHTKSVESVAVAPDGRRMLSGSADGTARLWDLATSQSLHEWKGHQGPVKAVAFSPDGRLAATAGQDRLVYLWDSDANKKVQTFTGHGGPVTALAFSPDGRFLLSAAEDGTARIWELTGGQQLFQFGPLGQSITALSLSADGATLALSGPFPKAMIFNTPLFLRSTRPGLRQVIADYKSAVDVVTVSPDGKHAAWAGSDHVIRLWDLAGMKQIREFPGHQDIIVSLNFSADGQRLLSASRDRTIRLWDVAKGSPLQVFQTDSPLQQAVFFPGGQRVLAAEADNVLRLWDVVDGKPSVVQTITAQTRHMLPLPVLATSLLGLSGTPWGQGPLLAVSAWNASHAPIWGVACSPDGKRIATAGGDKTVILFDAAGNHLQALDTSFEPRRILFAPDRSLLAAGDRLAQVWRFPAGGQPVAQALAGHADTVTALTVSRDAHFALTGDRSGAMILWDLEGARPLHFFTGHKGAVKDVALFPDLRQAISVSEDGAVRLWNLPACIADPTPGRAREFGPHPQTVEQVAVSPDGKIIATACRDHLIRLWDLATSKEVGRLTGHTKSVRTVSFSPDGKWLASGGEDATVRLWRIDGLKEVLLLKGHEAPVTCLAFTPDGRQLLTGGMDKTAVLWDLATAQPAQTFRGHQGKVRAIAFVLGSQRVLTVDDDGTMRLWDVNDPKKVQDLTNVLGPIQGVAVSPDGKLVATAGLDATVNVVDLTQGKLLHALSGHSGPVSSVMFSPDGRCIVSGGADKTVRLWDVPGRKLLHTFPGSTAPITTVAFTPDGLSAVTSGDDRVIRMWTLSILHPAKFARK